MGYRFGTGEGGKNHRMLTTKQKLDYTTGNNDYPPGFTDKA